MDPLGAVIGIRATSRRVVSQIVQHFFVNFGKPQALIHSCFANSERRIVKCKKQNFNSIVNVNNKKHANTQTKYVICKKVTPHDRAYKINMAMIWQPRDQLGFA